MARPSRPVVAALGLALGLLAGGCSGGGGQAGTTASPAPPGPSGTSASGDGTQVTNLGKAVGLAYGFGSVWVVAADTDQVYRLDQDGFGAAQIAVGRTPLRLAVTPAGVWVSEFDGGTVALVDPESERVSARVAVGAQPEGLATDKTHLWVVLQRDDELVELDATTGAHLRTVRLLAGGEPRLAAFAPAAAGRPATVWVSDYGGNRVVPVDATTGKVGAPVAACAAPQALAVDGPTLWVACQDGWLSTVDLTSHRTAHATDLRQLDGSPDAITVADGKVWTALSTGPVVLTVDPVRKTVTGSKTMGADGPLVSADVDVLVAQGSVWVTSYNGMAVYHAPVGSIGPPP